MTIEPRDLLAYIGGAALEQYGALTRMVTTVGRGGEGDQETFTRTGGAFYTDRDGQLKLTAANGPRITYPVIDGDSYLLVEPTRTNLVTDSEDFSAWTTGGTIGVTGSKADPEGGTTAYELDSNDTAADLVYLLTAFTGNAEKCGSLYFREGTSAAFDVGIYDTAPAWRHQVRVTWTANVPALSTIAGGGTLYPIETLANGWFRMRFSAESVVAANTNRMYIYPDPGGGLGTVFVYGAQAENAIVPSSYIATVSGTAARNTETFSVPFYGQPQAMSIYAKFLERGALAMVNDARIWTIGKTDDTAPRIFLYEVGGKYSVIHDNDSSTVSSTAAAAVSDGEVAEVLCTIDASGSVQLTQSIDGGAEAAAAASGNLALATAWSDTVLWPQCAPSAGAALWSLNPLRALIVARGSHTITDFQGLLP